MALCKITDLIKAIQTARFVCPDPVGAAYNLTLEGWQDALKGMQSDGDLSKHPLAGLILWTSAYGRHPDIQRPVTELMLAMDHLHTALKRCPPDEWEKKVRDPARQEQGYSIDTLFLGSCGISIDPESARQMIRDKLEHDSKPPEPPAPPPPDIACTNGWIRPNGKLEVVGFEDHIGWCDENDITEGECEEKGWVKITQGRVYLYGKPPTKRQWTKLFDWCQYHGKDYAYLEKEAKKAEGRAFVSIVWDT